MKLVDLGEFGLIDRIARHSPGAGGGVVVGIGDDAAVLKTSRDRLLLATTDAMIEGVHFDLKYSSLFSIGWKALSSNISDCVAKGGVPKEILVTVGLPENVSVEGVDELYKGIRNLAKRYRIDIIGGDTVSSPRGLVVSITLLGEVRKKDLLLRSGARPGDVILVTGTFGDSAAGLMSLKTRDPRLEIRNSKLVKKHLMPEPRVKEAKAIAESRLATSMMDDSDGLARCVLELARMSRVGAKIDLKNIPVSPQTKKFCERTGSDPIDLALNGGEDYELVLTCSKSKASKLIRQVKEKAGTNVTAVGEIVLKKSGIKLADPAGRMRPLKFGGYDHFKK